MLDDLEHKKPAAKEWPTQVTELKLNCWAKKDRLETGKIKITPTVYHIDARPQAQGRSTPGSIPGEGQVRDRRRPPNFKSEEEKIMPRKRRKYKHRPGKYRGGQVIVNKKDYTRRDHISPGRLVAWAEWIPYTKPRNREGKEA